MAVVELSVLAVLAAVQTCVRGTVGQEDRTPRELRLESGQPGSREGSARQARREIRVVAGELGSSVTQVQVVVPLYPLKPVLSSATESFSCLLCDKMKYQIIFIRISQKHIETRKIKILN